MNRLIHYLSVSWQPQSVMRAMSMVFVVILAIVLFGRNFDTPWQHFTDQAKGFTEGRFDSQFWTTQDLVEKDGKYYWPNGPFPAVVMVPFVLVSEQVTQTHIQFGLGLILFILCVYLANTFSYKVSDSLYLGFAFLFSSMIYPLLINPKSWYYSQIVALVCSVGALILGYKRKYYILSGILIGGIIATRPTAGCILAVILFWLWSYKHAQIKTKLLQTFLLFVPILVSGIVLLWFNFVRFGNIFDNGYTTNNVGGTSEPIRAIGVFSVQHIPMNFYWYFLASVTPVDNGTAHLVFPYISYSVWGLSLGIVAPFFFHSLTTIKRLDGERKFLWSVVGVTTLILLMYFNTGWYTYGPRYFADIFPVIYVLTLMSFPNRTLPNWSRYLILGTALLNSYLLLTTPI